MTFWSGILIRTEYLPEESLVPTNLGLLHPQARPARLIQAKERNYRIGSKPVVSIS